MESGLGQATEVRTATRYCNASSKAQIMPFCRGAGHGSKLCPSKQRLDRSTMVLIQPCFPGPLLLASGPILQQVLDVVQRSAAWSEPTPRTSSGQQVRDSRSSRSSRSACGMSFRNGRMSVPTFFSFYAARVTFVRNVPYGCMVRYRPKDGAGESRSTLRLDGCGCARASTLARSDPAPWRGL
jgi:hypothetical protein